MPLTAESRTRWQHWANDLPFVKSTGVRCDLSDPCELAIVVDTVTERFAGGQGGDLINGSIIAGLFDCAVGVCGMIHFKGKTSGTVSLDIHYIAGLSLQPFRVVAGVIRKSSSIAYCDAAIADSRGHLCATARALVSVTHTTPSSSLHTLSRRPLYTVDDTPVGL